MSIDLVDSQGRSLTVNAWNWGLLHFTIECARPALFPDADFRDRLRSGGAELSTDQVGLLCQYLDEVVLPRIGPGQRMLHDLSVTNEPDDGTFHRDQLEKYYSLHHDVLVSVIRFLRDAHAPVAVR
jgi:hypothetical protein